MNDKDKATVVDQMHEIKKQYEKIMPILEELESRIYDLERGKYPRTIYEYKWNMRTLMGSIEETDE